MDRQKAFIRRVIELAGLDFTIIPAWLCTEGPAGMSLWANWNGTCLPELKGTPLEVLLPNTIDPYVAAPRTVLISSGDLPSA